MKRLVIPISRLFYFAFFSYSKFCTAIPSAGFRRYTSKAALNSKFESTTTSLAPKNPKNFQLNPSKHSKFELFEKIVKTSQRFSAYEAFKQIPRKDYKNISPIHLSNLLASICNDLIIINSQSDRRKEIKNILGIFEAPNYTVTETYYKHAIEFYSRDANVEKVDKMFGKIKSNNINLDPEIPYQSRLLLAYSQKSDDLCDGIFKAYESSFPHSQSPSVFYMWLNLSRRPDKIPSLFRALLKRAKIDRKLELTGEAYSAMICFLSQTENFTEAYELIQVVNRKQLKFERKVQVYVLNTIIEVKGYDEAKEQLCAFFDGDLSYECVEVGMKIAASSRMDISDVLRMYARAIEYRKDQTAEFLSFFGPALLNSTDSITDIVDNCLRLPEPARTTVMVDMMLSFANRGDMESLKKMQQESISRVGVITTKLQQQFIRSRLNYSTWISKVLNSNPTKAQMEKQPEYKSDEVTVAVTCALEMYKYFENGFDVRAKVKTLGELLVFALKTGCWDTATEIVEICSNLKVILRKEDLEEIKLFFGKEFYYDSNVKLKSIFNIKVKF
ncbi:hypothetical protein HK098_003473 [Nowakowskiella sp. JEL0407]|nr:hypothetical protein HK098_003473 [Nowakowskiella sp. JEL0407]